MLGALSRHHGDEQVGQVEGAHHSVDEVALAPRLRLDPRIPRDCLLGEHDEGVLVPEPDGVDEGEGNAARRVQRWRGRGGCVVLRWRWHLERAHDVTRHPPAWPESDGRRAARRLARSSTRLTSAACSAARTSGRSPMPTWASAWIPSIVSALEASTPDGTQVAREGDDGVEQPCRELRGRRTIVRRTNVVPSRRLTWGVQRWSTRRSSVRSTVSARARSR